jgi:hypothetical protein
VKLIPFAPRVDPTSVSNKHGDAKPWWYIYRQHAMRMGESAASRRRCDAVVELRRLIRSRVADPEVRRRMRHAMDDIWSAQTTLEHIAQHATAATVGDYDRFVQATDIRRMDGAR